METTSTAGQSVSQEGLSGFPIPTARLSGPELDREIHAISKNEIVTGLLAAVHGLVAVLNEHRQVLALNEALFAALGTPNLPAVLGLRLGEIVRCVHGVAAPGGCGTSEHCPSCGAAIAQVAALAGHPSGDQLCAIEVQDSGDRTGNLFFRVCASPFNYGGEKFILLFLRDVSIEQRAASLEQVFLHDLRNTAQGLSMGASLLAQSCSGDTSQIARDVLHLAERLAREIELQRCLASSNLLGFHCQSASLSITRLYMELERSCLHHPARSGRELAILPPFPDITVASDPTLLHRILYNMVINALEATPPSGLVRVSALSHPPFVTFSVWNASFIPPEIARRIFQRNFSTKEALGHGLGTYSMKLLGEKLLPGHVNFTSSPEGGTTFCLELPVRG